MNLIKKGNAEEEFLYKDKKNFRILHAPSNPNFKGTEEIRNTIKCLKNENIDFEYIEITNASNEKVLAELKACDLVIDQLYSDTPMATLAAEAAYCGKPTIVGGYGFEELKKVDRRRIMATNDSLHTPEIQIYPQSIYRKSQAWKRHWN